MPGRISPLSLAVGLSAMLAGFLAPGDACAHRLDAQVFVLPNRQIQVESWFTNGEAAKGAKVQVFAAQDQLVTQGQLDEQGIFVFPYGEVDPRTVVISAGAGHRKVLAISASALARATAATATDLPVGANEVPALPVPLAERDSGATVKDVLVGVGFLLALAAFVLSLRNARKLRSLGGPNN